jgi:hypothetical protein
MTDMLQDKIIRELKEERIKLKDEFSLIESKIEEEYKVIVHLRNIKAKIQDRLDEINSLFYELKIKG